MNNLLAAKEQASALDKARNQRLEQALYLSSQGISLMVLAELQNYQDREMVLQACHYFMDAIQIKRDLIEPYLHLARAFIVFNDDRQALKYLLQARDFEPEHPDILSLLAFLQTSSREQAQTASKSSAPPELHSAFSESLKAQDLEELETQILQDIRSLIASEQTQVRLSLKAKAHARLEATYQNLKTQYKQIQKRLNLLARETEVSGLELSLRPVEILLRRFQATLRLSTQLMGIQNEIQRWSDTVDAALQRMNDGQDLPAPQKAEFEAELEAALDACDAIADQLDELAESNQDISLVEGAYQDLVTQIVNWQDLLDT